MIFTDKVQICQPTKDVLNSCNESLEGIFEDMYEFLGADSEDHFAFCPSKDHAIQLIAEEIYVNVMRKTGKNRFLIPSIEKVSEYKKYASWGSVLELIPMKSNGILDLDALRAAGPKSASLYLSWADPVTGVIQPIEEIAKICREKKILLHVDASHVVGKLYFRFCDTSIDYLSFSGSEIHGPRSSAGVFIRKDRQPLRTLHRDVPMMRGLSTALRQSSLYLDRMGLEIVRLRNLLEDSFSYPVQVLFKDSSRLPNSVVLAFPGIHNEMLRYRLSKKGVFLFPDISKTLIQCQCDPTLAYSALSFLLSRYSTQEEINQVICFIHEELEQLATLSEDLL